MKLRSPCPLGGHRGALLIEDAVGWLGVGMGEDEPTRADKSAPKRGREQGGRGAVEFKCEYAGGGFCGLSIARSSCVEAN